MPISSNTAKILLIISNFLIYITICFLIIRNKKFSSLSIRSPLILNINILFLFLIQTSLLFEFTFFKNLFYFLQTSIFLSFFIRFIRIYFCVKTPSLTRNKQHFQSTINYYKEPFYVKVLFLFIIATVAVLVIIKYSLNYNELVIASLGNSKQQYQINCWIIVNCIEMFILFTGNYLLYSYPIYHFIKMEFLIFTCMWLGFSYLITYFDFFSSDNENVVFWFVYCFQYLICILIGIIPFLLTKFSQVNFSYYFTQGLSDNLFLFLSNETCYKAFVEFIKDSEKEVLYLQLYTHIMNFKLECAEENFVESKMKMLIEVIDLYFNDKGLNYLKSIDIELWKVAQNVKRKYNENLELKNKQECVDEVLKYVFENLLMLFNDFKNTIDFCYLIDRLKLNAFIQCKMINVGLLNKH